MHLSDHFKFSACSDLLTLASMPSGRHNALSGIPEHLMSHCRTPMISATSLHSMGLLIAFREFSHRRTFFLVCRHTTWLFPSICWVEWSMPRNVKYSPYSMSMSVVAVRRFFPNAYSAWEQFPSFGQQRPPLLVVFHDHPDLRLHLR